MLKRSCDTENEPNKCSANEGIGLTKKPKLSSGMQLTLGQCSALKQSNCESDDDEMLLQEVLLLRKESAPVLYSKPELGLNVDYYHQLYINRDSNRIFRALESKLRSYFELSENKVVLFGKMHTIPRKQAAFGDNGLTYTFSGVTLKANTWIPIITALKFSVEEILGESFNFVLVNRYQDGADHMGEHQDNEKDLVSTAPIAGLSFGQPRDFIFKHKDSRGRNATKKNVGAVTVSLGHGSLVVMNYPTNRDWYHSIPLRRTAAGTRISLTFRRLHVPI